MEHMQSREESEAGWFPQVARTQTLPGCCRALGRKESVGYHSKRRKLRAVDTRGLREAE
jgi:hypothetical protein